MQQLPTGLSQPALDALETFVYYDHATKGITEDQLRNGPVQDANRPACSICHDEYEAQNILRRLPCSHAFHQACIDQWLRLQGTCVSSQPPLHISGASPQQSLACQNCSLGMRANKWQAGSPHVGLLPPDC